MHLPIPSLIDQLTVSVITWRLVLSLLLFSCDHHLDTSNLTQELKAPLVHLHFFLATQEPQRRQIKERQTIVMRQRSKQSLSFSL